MRKFLLIILFTLTQITLLVALTVTGKLVDQNGTALAGYTIKMYINPSMYTTTSATNGTFTFNNVTEVDNEQLPSDYYVSNNFPNPFNPTTRIEVSIPKSGRIKVELFNSIGQKVQDNIEMDANAGKSYFDLELKGLPNGIYLAKINIDDEYTIIKKLILLYGSQHLGTTNSFLNELLNKSATPTPIDSIVVSWSTVGKKTFPNPGSLVNGTKNLGNLIVEQSSISGSAVYANTTIPISGVTVNIDDQYYTTSSDGKFQLNYLTQGIKNLKATKEGYDSFTKTVNIIVGINSPLIAQMTSALFTHNLYGTIKDAETLQPISGVLVTVINDDGSPSSLKTPSDFTGYYQVPTVPQGTRTVTFTKTNYVTQSIQLFISNSDYQYNVGLEIICPTSVAYEGKTYSTIAIGTQCWLKKNLDVGTMVPGMQEQTNNGVIEKYCYDDNPNNCNTYGGLYQVNESILYAITEGVRGICPEGWHIPTNSEFDTLQKAVRYNGNALKEIGQGYGDGAGTNQSGFSALLAGARGYDGLFYRFNTRALFWSSTFFDGRRSGNTIELWDNTSTIFSVIGPHITTGYSIRCIRD